jgi:hypothetical protein
MALGLTLMMGLSGCVFHRTVVPVADNTKIQKLYVVKNRNFLNSNDVVRLQGIHSAIVTECRSMGFDVEEVMEEMPAGARYFITYNAAWMWDLGHFLLDFDATLHDGDNQVASAKFDARSGGLRMDKWANSGNKIRPLIRQMLSGASPGRQP